MSRIDFSPPSIGPEEVEAVSRVLKSGWLTTGPEVGRLESELAAYLRVNHAVAVSSCTAALEVCYAYLALGDGARVGIPTWTFVSTATAAVRAGYQPVLLDVSPSDLNLDLDSLTEAFEDGLDAVVPVHFAGNPVDDNVFEFCRANDIKLIEDSAHALGMKRDSSAPGAASLASCYSFYATKNMTTGEGGAIGTNSDELAAFARSYRSHGLTRDSWGRYGPDSTADYDMPIAGIKATMPDVLAAIGRVQLAKFDQMQADRFSLVEAYRRHLAEIDLVEPIPAEAVEGSANHLFVVRLAEPISRHLVESDLASAGVATSVHFRPLHTFSWFQENAILGKGGAPNADALKDRVISLPLHPEMSVTSVERVCEALSEALSGWA